MTGTLTDLNPTTAAARRGAAVRENPRAIPAGAARLQPFRAQLRAATIERNGKTLAQLEGYASMVERGYEVWDLFGPYTEVVAGGAFEATLAAKPDVAFLVNHKGMTMARTSNDTLLLAADALGLRSTAYLNPSRSDVADLLHAIDDKCITEMSFAFMIDGGEWNEDYTEYRITQINLDRGDVSAVNYGANPYTSIAARSAHILREVGMLPPVAQRAALQRLARAAAEGDEDPNSLIGALDAALDQAMLLLAGADLATLPADVQQALALVAGADSLCDRAMGLLGIPDPDEPTGEDRALLGAALVRGAIPTHHTATVDTIWDGPAATAAASNTEAVLRHMHAWVDSSADPTAKSSYKLPHHAAGAATAANLNGVRNALARLPNTDIPAGDKAAVRAHLEAHLKDGGGGENAHHPAHHGRSVRLVEALLATG